MFVQIIQILMLLIRFNVCETGCSWLHVHDNQSCNVYCVGVDYAAYGSLLYGLQSTRDICDHKGLILEFKITINSPTSTHLPTNWFPKIVEPVKIVELNLQFSEVLSCEDDILFSFSDVQKLTLFMSKTGYFKKRMFNGLTSLTHLTIITFLIQLIVIESDLLWHIRDTLINVIITPGDPLHGSSEIAPINVIGYSKLTKLKEVSFSWSTISTLTNKTLSGLINIEHLDFSNCKMNSIGEGTFDSIKNTIRTVNLRGNFLKTLPLNLFTNILPHSNLIFYLDENMWNCNCNLQAFKVVLDMHPSNFGRIQNIVCTEPVQGCPITEDSCFVNCAEPQFIPVTCSNYNHSTEFDMLNLKYNNDYKITITDIANDVIAIEVIVNLENKTILLDVNYLNNDIIEQDCVSITNRTTIIKKTLQYNGAYIFCLMDKSDTVTLPLNCISFYMSPSAYNIWLTEDVRILSICVLSIIILICFSIGFIIGFYVLKYNPEWLEGCKGVVIVQSTVKGLYERQLEMQRRSSYHYIHNIYERLPSDIRSISSSFDSLYEAPMSQFDYVKNKIELQKIHGDNKENKIHKNYYDLETMPADIAPGEKITDECETKKND